MSSGTSTASANTNTKRHLGVVSYKASPTEEPHKGDIVVSTTAFGKNTTKLRHNGNEWANALVWIEKQFNYSGKACSIRFTTAPQQTPSTPRPIYRSYSHKDGFV
jgi:hypothetical protein